MKLGDNGQLFRVFIAEFDNCRGQSLIRAIVMKVRELGMAGVTVFQCAMGDGAYSRLRSVDWVDSIFPWDVIILVVDSTAKIAELLPFLDESNGEGMVTIESVKILEYRHDSDARRIDESSWSSMNVGSVCPRLRRK